MTEKSLNHYTLLRLTDDFWRLPESERGPFFTDLHADLAQGSTDRLVFVLSQIVRHGKLLSRIIRPSLTIPWSSVVSLVPWRTTRVNSFLNSSA